MKPGKGNDLDIDSSVSDLFELPERKRGLSINGEIVPERDLDCINIHDFAVFEKEQDLIPEFRVSIKSRSSASSDGLSPNVVSSGDEGGKGFRLAGASPQTGETKVTRTPSFKHIAQQVRMVEKVLLRWPCRPRSRHHSSSSEDLCEDDLETNNNEAEVMRENNAAPDVLLMDTVVFQLSTQGIHVDSLADDTEVNSGSLSPPEAAEVKGISDRVDSTPDKDLSPDQNSSSEAQSVRDINLNKDKNAVGQTTESKSTPESPANKVMRSNDVPVSQSDPSQNVPAKPLENSRVVENSQAQPPPPSKPECCDRDGVVHDVASLTGPHAAQVKVPAAKEGESPQEARSCPCVPL